MPLASRILVAVLLLSPCPSFALHPINVLGPQAVNLWKLDKLHSGQSSQASSAASKAQKPFSVPSSFEAHWFEQPLDHFSDLSDTFLQRFWINTRHYNQSAEGPVIVLDGGETSGENRFPFLDTGIVNILAEATGGIGIVLEHRYYGQSIAVKNLTTDSLRFLNNAQSAADSANFMRNIQIPGISNNVTAPGTPWIYYGGSYAGARAAHMKILYPELVYGAIASSAVTHASIINWEYMDIIRRSADPICSRHIQGAIETVDRILRRGILKQSFKGLFGLTDLSHDDDFASVLESPLGSWQAQCWDPAFGSTRFDEFCDALSKPPFGRAGDLTAFEYNHPKRMVNTTEGLSLDFTVLNYAKYIKENIVSRCPTSSSVEECFGTYDDTQYLQFSLDQTWRLWLFQVCTEWGYFTTAPPDPTYPRIISRLLTLAYESKICNQAYPPGIHFSIPSMPNVSVVNELGDFGISDDRLAIIDGEVDPWRPMTPHSQYASERKDTNLRPFKLIPGAVHHYDEWGYMNLKDEPPEIEQIHREMISFVLDWLKDWKQSKETGY